MSLGMPTFGQSLPIFQGVQSGQDLLRQYLQNQAMRQQNQVAPQLAQSLLRQREMQNQLSEARLPLLQEQLRAQQIANEQAPRMLDLKNRGLDISERRLGMQEAYNKLQRDKMTSLMGNMLTRLSNTPGGQALIENNPDFVRNLLQGAVGASGQFANPDAMMGQQMQQPMMQDIGQQQQSPLASAITDDQVRAAQEATGDVLAKKRTDQSTRNQKRFSMVLNNIVGKREDDLPRLFDKFVGAKNKPAYLAGIKRGDPDALAFRSFLMTDIPQIANELKRTMGGQATDQETKLMESIVNPNWWFGDGRQALSQWNSFLDNNRLIEQGLDVPIRDLFKQPQQQSVLSQAIGVNNMQTISAAPSGSTMMVGTDGQYYVIPNNEVNEAMAAGYKRAD